MEKSALKLKADDVFWQTDINREKEQNAIKYAFDLLNDPNKKARKTEGMCKLCYYDGPSIGGSAVTDTNCRICMKGMSFATTVTDKLCTECAVHHELCKHCGAMSKPSTRRKRFEF